MQKKYYTYEKIHKIINKIAEDIINDNWTPDCIVAISAGGFIPARILRNHFKKDIYAIGIKKYDDENIIHETPIKIQWIDEVERILKNKKILLVDEIDDTRDTLSFSLNELFMHEPSEIRVAVIHQKQKEKKSHFPEQLKKIYIGEIVPDSWIIYPWEIIDIDGHNELSKKDNT